VVAFIGVMNPVKAKAEEKEYKPYLMLYEEYHKVSLIASWNTLYKYEKEYDPTDTIFFYNPYKIMVDTNWKGEVPPFLEPPPCWSKKCFIVRFERNIIPRKEIYEDNRLIYYTIDDILPKHEKTIQDFKKLEEKWGKFRFVDTYSAYPDTTHYWFGTDTIEHKRELSIEFDNYVPTQCYASIECLDLKKVDLVNYAWFEWGIDGLAFHSDIFENNNPKFKELLLFPNITSEEITIILNNIDLTLPNAITVTDITGKVVKSLYIGLDTEQNIDVRNLPSGHYNIQIGNYIGKFIIRR
jgi:hypothetical protein